MLIQNFKIQTIENLISFEFDERTIEESEIPKILEENLVKLIFRAPWAKFFRRDIIVNNKLTYIRGIKIGEDTLFMLDYLYFVHSIKYLSSSFYVYQKDEDAAIKYKLCVSKCLEIFELIIYKYEKLNVNSIPFLNFITYFYNSLINPRDYSSLCIWNMNKTVIRVRKLLGDAYGLRWKIRFLLSQIKEMLQKFLKM